MNDTTLKRYGQSMNILRTGGNIATKGYHVINTSLNIRDKFALAKMMFPVDTGPVAGDILDERNGQFWLVAVAHKESVGDIDIYDTSEILDCNALITIERMVNGVKTVVGTTATVDGHPVFTATTVHCQITKSRLTAPNEQPAFQDNPLHGGQQVHYVYTSINSGLVKNDIIIDSISSRILKILNNLTPYLAEGLMEAEAVIQDA